MNRRRSVILVLTLFLSVVLIAAFMPDAPSKGYYSNISRPFVIAHQGGDGLWTGDTMYAFQLLITDF
jgi:hypothetical protein